MLCETSCFANRKYGEMAAEKDDFSNVNLVSKKSSAELNQPQTEKPLHYTLHPQTGLKMKRYLKEFRVEQCSLFLQHKCTQHRPFSCFCWHFLNQKRRRPRKKKDGTFTYSPDVYCQQYNETTGECVNGDDCPFLHRVAGDVERRYHLRYYKTSPCVYETDTRGYCVKNGPHCAFAHGPHDLRQPVYDIRELQIMDQEEKEDNSKQIVPEDPRWNDTNYVLSTYKTEPCKKPPRLCRQGYACPQYHNNRDRRRSPRKYKYRSTPCPNVKHADEWGDPSTCENGDSCAYCHTRTEQQFHPEIYKSTKCNDMQQTAQCPRGPFCAFAHIEQDQINAMEAAKGSISIILDKELMQQNQQAAYSSTQNSPLPSPAGLPNNRPKRSASLSGPYAKIVEGTISSMHNVVLSSSAPTYEKAPGSGRRSNSRDSDQCQSFFGPTMSQSSQGSEPRTPSKAMSAGAQSFYPEAAFTDETALDNALLDAISNIDNTFDFDFPDNASVGSSLGGAGSTGGIGFNTSSFLEQFSNGTNPVSIPGTEMQHSFTSQHSQSPTSPNIISGTNNSFYSNQTASRASYLRSPKNSQLGIYEMLQSPKFNSPSLASPLALSNSFDIQRSSDEIISLRSRLASWEESWNQAKIACDAWKREASEQSDKAQSAEREKMQILIKLGEAEAEVRYLKLELERKNGGSCIHLLKQITDLDNLSILDLKQIYNQLKNDTDRLEKIISKRESMKCILCEETPRCVVTYPCTHCVMCGTCAAQQVECPFCNQAISQKTTIFIPV
ncbi:putative E3 ubiquitin-protein ligase UNKL isoform X2 [Hydra vulgaris]|uniref:putative E3 ubiquitin-protein ligase UNKL isoform X2 n=1 Tax=Hydra vulgaris TaxID=6087 RepID=UPI0006410EB0